MRMIHLWKDMVSVMAKPPWLAAPATMQEMTLPHRGVLTGWRMPIGTYGALARETDHIQGMIPVRQNVMVRR